ncbi:PD40 domain-containing protein [Psychrobacter sp. FDAARGOS_221]|uniref:PD40 domain-containing protein n=1 Tax=Psychrobacter sp. FDAARGOS_221 TaxID=1975705 RepID=UPI000BB57DB2|nr:PD40 domain-containing protein [Psychrobacter sp. FDAARGOS_221]PNK59887.1 hypothetical protein A6J60_002670 [Psychrobacter sp. FDAARGOS_221]
MTLKLKSSNLLTLSALSTCLISLSALSYPTLASAEGDDDWHITIDKQVEVSQKQIAFVPFAGSEAISSIIENDLKASPLKISSQGLIGQPHSSEELKVTLPAWQKLNFPHMIIGQSSVVGGKTQINLEVIEVANGRVIKGKHTVSDADPKVAAHKASNRIYELLTGKKLDLNAALLYIEEKDVGEQKISTLMLRDADGSNPTPLISVPDSRIYAPAVSPDGRYIAYSLQKKYNNAYLYTYDRQTRTITQLVNLKGSNLNPSFSPDGSMILFSNSTNADSDIYRVSSRGGQAERLSALALPYDQVSPSYAPNGSIVFVSDHANRGKPSIYRYNFRGAPVRLTHGGYATNPSVSADGTKIAFLSGSNAAIMDMSGNIIANYGSTGLDQAPSFSPYGQRVVYAKGAKNSSLVVRYVDGGQPVTIPVNGVAKSPIWVPSGK